MILATKSMQPPPKQASSEDSSDEFKIKAILGAETIKLPPMLASNGDTVRAVHIRLELSSFALGNRK